MTAIYRSLPLTAAKCQMWDKDVKSPIIRHTTFSAEYNKDVGFYEKSLLDKTYIEHYDFRRTPIADHDGPQRRPPVGRRVTTGEEKGGFGGVRPFSLSKEGQ